MTHNHGCYGVREINLVIREERHHGLFGKIGLFADGDVILAVKLLVVVIKIGLCIKIRILDAGIDFVNNTVEVYVDSSVRSKLNGNVKIESFAIRYVHRKLGNLEVKSTDISCSIGLEGEVNGLCKLVYNVCNGLSYLFLIFGSDKVVERCVFKSRSNIVYHRLKLLVTALKNKVGDGEVLHILGINHFHNVKFLGCARHSCNLVNEGGKLFAVYAVAIKKRGNLGNLGACDLLNGCNEICKA